jgi:hypothetical protein
MGAAWTRLEPGSRRFTEGCRVSSGCVHAPERWEDPVPDIFATDWFYIGLTIVVFAVLWLLVKGVERFER